MANHYQNTRYQQIIFYVPESHCEQVKEAMFNAGAGKLGDYEKCSWQTLGKGQFKPVEGSQPYIGERDKLERVDEYKVEMLCSIENTEDVIQALKSSHPYEVPAFAILQVEI